MFETQNMFYIQFQGYRRFVVFLEKYKERSARCAYHKVCFV